MSKRRVKHTKPVLSEQLRGAISSIMETHLKLDIHGRELDDEMLWDILSYASVNGVMIETASNELEGAPSGNTVREHLTGALDETRAGVVALEAQLNTALLAQLPRHVRKRLWNKRFEVGIDLVGIPYHGQPSQDSNEIRRSRARSGTQCSPAQDCATHFHTYATLTIVHDKLRYALALTFVWADESLDQVLKRMILRVRALDLRIRRAYLDKGFCSTAVLRLLRRHRIPYIVPIPRWGKKGGGIKALFFGKRSYPSRTRYRCSVHGTVRDWAEYSTPFTPVNPRLTRPTCSSCAAPRLAQSSVYCPGWPGSREEARAERPYEDRVVSVRCLSRASTRPASGVPTLPRPVDTDAVCT